MARKNILNYQIIPLQDGSNQFDTKSNPTSTLYLDNISFQVELDGDLIGSLFVYVSNQTVDPKLGQQVTKWSEVFNVAPQIDMSTRTMLINMMQVPFQWIALEWAPGAGTGNINVLMTAKEIGG